MMQQQQVLREPAEKMYVFGEGWAFLGRKQARMSNWAQSSSQVCFSRASASNNVVGKFFCGLVGMAIYCIVMGAMLLFVSLYGFAMAIVAGFCLKVIGTLRFSNWLYRHIWQIDYDCPHPYCYARSSLPIFICSNPNCQRRHRQLHPNTFGIWSHRCECRTKLRTLERFGRKKLVRRCSACDNIINNTIGQNTTIHIPVIGGPFAGKTHYIVASTSALINTYRSVYAYGFSFPDSRHDAEFERNVQKLMRGEILAPTPEIAPPALTLKMDVPGVPVSKVLYVYDAAGEAYNANERTSLQTYYKHIRGLIFVIDPCAITNFRLKHEKQINAIASSLRPCQSEIMQVHDRMMRMVERTRGLRRWGRYRLPIAVVITKVDALGLEHVVGADAARDLMREDPSYTTEDDAINELVQRFLRQYGLSDLLRNLEYHFSTVRYFSCSVLGRSAGSIGFVPKRVLDPLSWLLSKARVVKKLQR